MSFRAVQVHEIREVLRLWVRGESERAVARLSLVDRKTVKRYLTAAAAAGLVRDGGEGQLTDGLIGQVCELVRPHRPDGHGAGWETLRSQHDQLKAWLVDEGLTVVKAHRLLGRCGSRSRSAPCTATRWKSSAAGGPCGGQRCVSRMASREPRCRSISARWACCSTR